MAKATAFTSPLQAIEWIINNGLHNYTRCRIWAIKRHYEGLVSSGIFRMDAITFTAEEFCVDEETVKKAIYRHKDI